MIFISGDWVRAFHNNALIRLLRSHQDQALPAISEHRQFHLSLSHRDPEFPEHRYNRSVMRINEYLCNPYPRSLKRWGIIITISLFISFFMVVFQPFGLQRFESGYKTLILAGFGGVTFFMLIINMVVLPGFVPALKDEEHWTILRQILWLTWIILSISIANYLYSILFSVVSWYGMTGLLIFFGFTFVISIFPVVGVTVISHNRLMSNYLRDAGELNDILSRRKVSTTAGNVPLVITSGNGRQKVEVAPEDLLYIASEGNYADVRFLSEGRVGKAFLRSTMKHIEAQMQGQANLFRCHRAFIVNLGRVEKVRGNSQGYRLMLEHSDKEVPVSRNYTREFREAMQGLS